MDHESQGYVLNNINNQQHLSGESRDASNLESDDVYSSSNGFQESKSVYTTQTSSFPSNSYGRRSRSKYTENIADARMKSLDGYALNIEGLVGVKPYSAEIHRKNSNKKPLLRSKTIIPKQSKFLLGNPIQIIKNKQNEYQKPFIEKSNSSSHNFMNASNSFILGDMERRNQVIPSQSSCDLTRSYSTTSTKVVPGDSATDYLQRSMQLSAPDNFGKNILNRSRSTGGSGFSLNYTPANYVSFHRTDSGQSLDDVIRIRRSEENMRKKFSQMVVGNFY